jgi:hypothetical protein
MGSTSTKEANNKLTKRCLKESVEKLRGEDSKFMAVVVWAVWQFLCRHMTIINNSVTLYNIICTIFFKINNVMHNFFLFQKSFFFFFSWFKNMILRLSSTCR